MFGGVAAAVLVLAAVLVVVLNGDDGTNAQNDPGPGAASSQPTSPSSPPPSTISGSDTEVEWGPAGQAVVDYYLDVEDSWDMLSHTTRALFGSESEYEAYWADKNITTIQDASAYKGRNNPDGSVDIQVHVDFGNGLREMYLRVYEIDDEFVLDGDPRPENNNRL